MASIQPRTSPPKFGRSQAPAALPARGHLRGELDLYHRALRVDREAGVDGLREVRDELAGADVPRPGLRAEGLLHVPGHRVRRGRVVDLS